MSRIVKILVALVVIAVLVKVAMSLTSDVEEIEYEPVQ